MKKPVVEVMKSKPHKTQRRLALYAEKIRKMKKEETKNVRV